MKKPVLFCFVMLALGMIFVQATLKQAHAALVQNFEVKGAERIEVSTILSYIDMQAGDQITQDNLDRTLKTLFSTGLFADVKVSQDNNTVVISVVENPIINLIVFEGNDQLDDDELRSEIQMRPRQVFTRTKVQGGVSRLYQIYRRNGRFSANIEPKIVRLDQNRVNLVFEIAEGPITKIQSIRFVGNKVYNDSKLRSEISTKETEWYRFITADDRYDPDRLSYDQELLRRFYLSEGYADFEIVSATAELSNDRDHFFVTFTIKEGDRYKFGETTIDSRLRDFDPEVLKEHISYTQDDWYNANRVQETVDKMTDKLGDLQYAFVNIRPDVDRDRENNIINVKFRINETPRVFVERININGNIRTLDKVVRREMLLVEGDPYNKSRLSRSEQNIRNLDFFETVELKTRRGSTPDKIIIDVNVSEKSTGELSVGAGFSTSDGLLTDLRVREKNLLGKGQDLLFSATLAGERTEFDISFTEPFFLNRDVSAGFDLFHVTRDLQDESSFDQRRTGGALRVGYPLSERWRQTIRFRGERNEITDVSSDASRFIRDQEGERDTLALSQRITYDNRDSVVFPTDGWLYWFDTEVTGFGGDSKYVSGRTGTSFYYPVYDQVVLNILGEVGAIEGYGDENVAINERFYMGGGNLRGFAQAGVGPRDTFTDDALGGNRFYRGTAELSFPIYGIPDELGILGHTFGDAGSLFEVDVDTSDPNVEDTESLRASVGVGLSWRSPFGPIRFDLAKAVAAEDYDDEESFRFNFGTRF